MTPGDKLMLARTFRRVGDSIASEPIADLGKQTHAPEFNVAERVMRKTLYRIAMDLETNGQQQVPRDELR